ncbi:MAG: hypothetical protein AAFX93_02510 [Verrucomicrobiota bacterium]
MLLETNMKHFAKQLLWLCAIALCCASSFAAQENYRLRGVLDFGRSTQLTLVNERTGAVHQLKVGDSQNRAIHVVSWDEGRQEAQVSVNGHIVVLKMDVMDENYSLPTPTISANRSGSIAFGGNSQANSLPANSEPKRFLNGNPAAGNLENTTSPTGPSNPVNNRSGFGTGSTGVSSTNVGQGSSPFGEGTDTGKTQSVGSVLPARSRSAQITAAEWFGVQDSTNNVTFQFPGTGSSDGDASNGMKGQQNPILPTVDPSPKIDAKEFFTTP